MPSLIVLLRYARLAGVPMEFIVDDEINMETFRHQLAIVDSIRGELHDPPDYRVTLFWHK